MEHSEEIQKQILKASWARFCHYGFAKTTMAEIAGDCEMSAANIYRFFDGKKAILAELARKLFRKKEAELSKLVKQDMASSLEKLHAFMLMEIDITHDQMANQPKISESVDFIQNERPELIQEHKGKIIALIGTIIKEGQQAGEFRQSDPRKTAEAIIAATAIFHAPFFMVCKTKEELRYLCEQVIALLGTGLLNRS